MNNIARWIPSIVIVIIPLGILLPALAQHRSNRSMGDMEAKKMVALLKQGQIELADAATIAESHTKGNALKATCELRHSEPADVPLADELSPERTGGDRLIYRVTCYANDKTQVVQIDGASKKVIGESPSRP